MTRLLVVEGESAIAIGLRDALRSHRYEVDVVNDGCDAERKARATQYDVVSSSST